MAVCAMVSAMAADTSLRASNCALAGVTNAQARPIAARRYDTTDMMKSSLGGRDRSDVAGGPPGKSLAHLRAFVRVRYRFPVRARDVVFAGGGKEGSGRRMSARRILVTGGSGFLGSGLVKALVGAGEAVRVFDDNSRGALHRLREVERDIEFVSGDIRDAAAVDAVMRGIDEVHHLAFVNGTATFYSAPDFVLDVGVKGIVNVIDSCRHHGVGRLILASSSEVYQSPPRVPTDEGAPLVVPDPHNPRLSYGAGKIISEMMVINHGRKHFERVLIFRPLNVYGPDMGFDHVIPQFAVRLKRAMEKHTSGAVPFPIQGSGAETRSFCHVDDLVQGVMVMRGKGEHLGIYHVGTAEEISIADLARRMAKIAGREIALGPSAVREGSTPPRCPDVSKLAALGYRPRVPLDEGLPPTLKWYWAHERMAPAA